eukprot:2145210-Rhodomonas_salina.1
MGEAATEQPGQLDARELCQSALFPDLLAPQVWPSRSGEHGPQPLWPRSPALPQHRGEADGGQDYAGRVGGEERGARGWRPNPQRGRRGHGPEGHPDGGEP